MDKQNGKITKNKNHFNISNNKFENKQEELCKRYFYKMNLAQRNKNIFHDMENGQNLDELEQVYNENMIFQKGRNKLRKKQLECLKSMVLHHKNIPERWIIRHNYKNLVDKIMQDPIVLSYAVFSKDYYRKRSTAFSIDVDDIKNHLSLSPKEPKFISYINPYSRNFDESSKKHLKRKEYGYNIKKRKNKEQNIYTLQTENNEVKNLKRNLNLNLDIDKEKGLPNIFGNMKKTKSKDEDKKTEDRNDLTMMTSLYYDENKLNEKKENSDKSKNDDEKQEKTFKKQKMELPMIEY